MTERKFVETLMARGFVSHATLRSAFTRDNVEVRVVSTKAMVLSGDGSAKWAPFDEALARLGIGAAGPFQMGSRVWPGLGKLVEEALEIRLRLAHGRSSSTNICSSRTRLASTTTSVARSLI